MRTHPPLAYLERDGSRLLGRVLRTLLDVAVGGDLPDRAPIVIGTTEWQELWEVLCRHRIETFLPAALDRGVISIPPEHLEVVSARAQTMAIHRLRLTASLRNVVALLERESIDVCVLKGLATGQLDYRQAAVRRTSDVDLLVRPQDFDRACAAVEGAGAIDLKAGEPSRLLVERTFALAGVQIDMHHRLFRFGGAHNDLLFGRPEPLPDGSALALFAEARLVHAAGHLLISPPGHRQMSSLFDVAVLAASPDVDSAIAIELGGRFGVGDIVRFGIWLAENVGLEHPVAPPRFRRTLINQAHLRTNRRIDVETLAILADLDGARDRLLHLRFQARRRPRGKGRRHPVRRRS